MKTLIIENTDAQEFRSTLETALTEAMAGQVVMSILYSTRTATKEIDYGHIAQRVETPVWSALIVYRPLTPEELSHGQESA